MLTLNTNFRRNSPSDIIFVEKKTQKNITVGHVGIIDFCLIYQYQIKKLYKKNVQKQKSINP